MELSRAIIVKIKDFSAVQITAEQIIREARFTLCGAPALAECNVCDLEELQEYQNRKRVEFEKLVKRRDGINDGIGNWVKYAKWEASQGYSARARSVFERALCLHKYESQLYVKYAEFEMRNRFLNCACNVWERAVTIFPGIDEIWLKYIHLEEMMGNSAAARRIFERWMEWEPEDEAWLSYIGFELRHMEIDRARALYEQFVLCSSHKGSAWIRYAEFENKVDGVSKGRACFERALNELSKNGSRELEELLVKFAEFEEDCGEMERARCILCLAHDALGAAAGTDFLRCVLQFDRRHGLNFQIHLQVDKL